MSIGFRRNLTRSAVCFLVWTALGLFMSSQGLAQKAFSRDPTPWWHYTLSWLVGVWCWWLMTPVVLWLGNRVPLERRHLIRRIALHLVLAPVVGLTQLALEASIIRSLHLFPTIMVSFAATFGFLLVIAFQQTILTYATILGVQYAYRWYERYQERRQEALRLQLR